MGPRGSQPAERRCSVVCSMIQQLIIATADTRIVRVILYSIAIKALEEKHVVHAKRNTPLLPP